MKSYFKLLLIILAFMNKTTEFGYINLFYVPVH
jgi:hypothetical protein